MAFQENARDKFSAKAAVANASPWKHFLRVADIAPERKCTIEVISISRNNDARTYGLFLLEIHPVKGKTVFPLNQTNVEIIAEIIGDDLTELPGKHVDLAIARFDVNGQSQDGLQVVAVREPPVEGAPQKTKRK